jgi:co-chaperonin GroES (HSP10)
MAVENTSGVRPIRDRVLLLPDRVEEKTESGRIYKPQTSVEREEMRQIKATLIALGGDAFDAWKDTVLQAGDRVYVKVAAGIVHDGIDGKKYRIVNDVDIIAIIDKE